jgi:hypothetical protein
MAKRKERPKRQQQYSLVFGHLRVAGGPLVNKAVKGPGNSKVCTDKQGVFQGLDVKYSANDKQKRTITVDDYPNIKALINSPLTVIIGEDGVDNVYHY